MLGENGHVMDVLLAHIALAVILAAYLNQFLGQRKLLSAVLGSVAALFTMGMMREHMFAVDQAASLLGLSFHSADAYWTHELLRSSLGAEFIFVMVFVAPFIFAYYAVWVWERKATRGSMAPYQVRLRILLIIVWTVCLALGLHRWAVTRSIPVIPLSLAAGYVLLRPTFVVQAIRILRRNAHRRLVIRRRLGQANVENVLPVVNAHLAKNVNGKIPSQKAAK